MYVNSAAVGGGIINYATSVTWFCDHLLISSGNGPYLVWEYTTYLADDVMHAHQQAVCDGAAVDDAMCSPVCLNGETHTNTYTYSTTARVQHIKLNRCKSY